MNRKRKTILGLSTLVLAFGIFGVNAWLSREVNAIVPLTAPPAELVKFTATKTYASLPLDERLKYLHAWGNLTPDQRASAIASLMNDQRALQISTMQSSDAMRLAQAREFFAIKDKASRNAYLDAQIDAENAMIKQGEAMVKAAEAQSGQKVKKGIDAGDPLVRKYILENAIPSNRLETNAFVNAMVQRRRERGLPT